MVNLGVEDLSDLKLWFAIYFDWWWRRLYPVWYGVGYGRFELGDMENGVNCMHGIWKTERKREGAYLRDDSVGSQCHICAFPSCNSGLTSAHLTSP